MRLVAYASLSVLFLAGASTGAVAGDDVSTVKSQCGVPDLAASSVDSCLERVRVLEETDPSADLQSLEQKLEQRDEANESATAARGAAAGGGSASDQYQPYSRWAAGQAGAAQPRSGDGTYGTADTSAPPPENADDASATAPGEPAGGQPGFDSGQPPRASVDADDEPPVQDPPDSSTTDDNPR